MLRKGTNLEVSFPDYKLYYKTIIIRAEADVRGKKPVPMNSGELESIMNLHMQVVIFNRDLENTVDKELSFSVNGEENWISTCQKDEIRPRFYITCNQLKVDQRLKRKTENHKTSRRKEGKTVTLVLAIFFLYVTSKHRQ